ncbi:hypothetical protein VTJ49DRAFT_6749 [Mycothermus thermophilus]|uniref:General negative regulator of transcription subunit 4 n=1 Tax=Humicola insolens TaxID=85995 RepID=A0ABR3VID6_HUMIN
MAPQDTYIDDEEDCCPLCIEEFDLSDRNFRPCPCGYQICQFCFNNIRNNMNGLCPACRRPYDDKTIQWKVVTQEEIAEFRANIQKNQKKRAAEQRQKEAQKREAEKENRKSLVGVRVVQKNLVYVTGLTPTVREDELLKTLRKPEFFGQYGNILKISISSRKGTDGQNQSLGVYVTFEKKEDAARCIAAVNGSQNGDRILRAQLGTTKYCSAWLRHEQCTNRQCMFLHELGDEEDSYSRQDLSSMNSINSQRPIHNAGASRSASRQQAHPSPSPAPAQPMARAASKDGSNDGDAPALPPSANWARNPQVRSRRGSHATSAAAPSPAISHSLPATAESAIEDAPSDPTPAQAAAASKAATSSKDTVASKLAKAAKAIPEDSLKALLKSLEGCSLAWPKLGRDLPSEELDKLYPPMFDPRGGMRRRAQRAAEESSSIAEQQSRGVREPSEGEPESSGSHALGGEPEDRDHAREGPAFDPRRVAQPPIQRGSQDGLFGQPVGSGFIQSAASLGAIGGSRTVTPQQPAFMRQPTNFVDHLSGQANLFQGQGHNRQGSRFSFATDGRDTTSATAVKLAANPRIMAQQSSMMPSTFHNQPSQYYAASMPGPPPGLKSTGTPPGVFGQHGFGSAFGGASKDANEMLQLFRGRGTATQAHDAAKHDEFSSLAEVTSSIEALVADEPIDPNMRLPPGAFDPLGRVSTPLGRTGTPTVPPGFSHPAAYASPAISHASLAGTSLGRQTPPVTKTPVKPPVAVASPLIKKAVTPTKMPAAESGLAKDTKGKTKVLTDEDFPALNATNPPRSATPVPSKAAVKVATPAAKKVAEKATDKGKDKAKGKDKEKVKEERSSGKEKEETEKAKEKETPAPAPPTPAPEKPEPPNTETKAAQKAPEKAADKKLASRPAPVLNIAAATATKTVQTKSAEAASASDKSKDDKSAFPPLPAATPSTASTPVNRPAPKTLRVVSTPKTETPSTPVLAAPALRSVAAATIRPETPASELISDSASIISASVSASRASSPPPSKVGSAPVRATTKSQQRKARKEALKKESATIAAQPVKSEPTPEIGPIVGRKKKQKKDKEKSTSKTATPAVSRPETPHPPTTAKETKESKETKEAKDVPEVKEESSAYRSTANETTTLTVEPLPPKSRYDAKGKGVDKQNSDASIPRTSPTPASVLRELQAAGLAPESLESLALFKPVSVQVDKSRSDAHNAILREQAAKNSMMPTKSIVTEEDQAALLAGKPVRKVVDGTRILLTPNGDCIRNLSPEEEDRFLELQQRVAETAASPATFVSSRHEAGGGFSLIKGRAVPNGPPSYFPPAPGAYPSDPINKIQREEAIYYINQYVLPRLNLNARDMNLPKAMSTWTTDSRGSSGGQSTAGPNLSSVAPWLYGGIAGAGSSSSSHLPTLSHGEILDVNAAAPELSYPGPVGAFADDMHHHHPYIDINGHLPTVEEVFNSAARDHHHHPHHHYHQQGQQQTPQGSASPQQQQHQRPSTPSSSNAVSAPTTAAGGINFSSPGPFGNVPLMSLEDAEQALAISRKETEKLEKSLNQLMPSSAVGSRFGRRRFGGGGGGGGVVEEEEEEEEEDGVLFLDGHGRRTQRLVPSVQHSSWHTGTEVRRRRDAVAAVATAVALARMLRGPPGSRNTNTNVGRGGRNSIRFFGEAAFATVLVALLLVESVVRVAARGAAGVVEGLCAVLDWVGAED